VKNELGTLPNNHCKVTGRSFAFLTTGFGASVNLIVFIVALPHKACLILVMQIKIQQTANKFEGRLREKKAITR